MPKYFNSSSNLLSSLTLFILSRYSKIFGLEYFITSLILIDLISIFEKLSIIKFNLFNVKFLFL